jgi:competence protein ComEC
VASDFQASGLVHLLVTSGLKVSLVGALAGAALRQAAPRAALGTAAAGMAAFAIVGGGSAAALRATLAGGTGMLAAATGRPAGALGTLPLVSAAMLALDPASAGSIGFQLTCAGTAGIALLPRELPGSAVIPRWMSEPALYTVAAGLATLPLVLDVFHIVSLWGPVANVLVLPLLPVAFIALLAGGGLAAALPGLAPVISVPAWLLVNWIETVAHITASLPLQLHAQHVEAPWVFLYYALLGSLAMAWRAHPR